MLVPVRCFACGKPLGGKIYEEFKRRVNSGERPEDVLNDLGIKRYCCRKTLLTAVELFNRIIPYKRG